VGTYPKKQAISEKLRTHFKEKQNIRTHFKAKQEKGVGKPFPRVYRPTTFLPALLGKLEVYCIPLYYLFHSNSF